MAIKAKQIKQVVSMQQDRDIWAKDDEKSVQKGIGEEPDPEKDPIKWRDWKSAQDRLKDIKVRRSSIDASKERGTES